MIEDEGIKINMEENSKKDVETMVSLFYLQY
jgi:hypothetical protein